MRRVRAVWLSFAVVLGLAAVTIIAAVLAIHSTWGREQLRKVVVGQLMKTIEGRGRVYVGHVDVDLSGHIRIDSVTLSDNKGNLVASVGSVEAQGSFISVLRDDIRLRYAVIVRPYLVLERKDSTWTILQILPPRSPTTVLTPRSTLSVEVDSAEVQDGHLVLITPDTSRSLPPVRRDFSAIQLVLGASQLMKPGGTGGTATLRRLAIESSAPRVSLREAVGTVRWGKDSLSAELATVRLPASHATARGRASWAGRGPAKLDIFAHADTVSLPEVAWLSSFIPKQGDGATDLHISNERGHPENLDYSFTNLDVRATKSRISGGFRLVIGRQGAIDDMAFALQPLDDDLIRELFGTGVLDPKSWQGAFTGTLHASGGPFTAFRLDSAHLRYDDRRVPGAVSTLTAAGLFDLQDKPLAMHGLDLEIQSLDIRTTGSFVSAADSLHGMLSGRVVLDGTVNNFQFSELSLVHTDGDRAPSHITGEGQLASDHSGQWLDARFVLDTIAIATFARDRSAVPLHGVARGTLDLRATRDTLSITTLLHTGADSVRFVGETLLDSGRTWVRGDATFTAFDPHTVMARKDIPNLKLFGTAGIEVESTGSYNDAHLDLTLDKATIIGASPVDSAHVRASFDSAGFHVDTAEIHTPSWAVHARGRLANHGATHDTLGLDVRFDSLVSLRALLLDSAGASMADSVHGSFRARGTLVGSLDSLALTVSYGLGHARWGDVTADTVSGSATLTGLPKSATGAIDIKATSVTAAGITATTVAAVADVRDGRAGRLSADITSGDTMTTRFVTDVTRAGDTTRVVVDSLGVVIGRDRWTLEQPTRIVIAPGSMELDSTVLRSRPGAALLNVRRGATVSVRLTLPDAGPISGAVHVVDLEPADLQFTGHVPPVLDGRARADLVITGTRDSPTLKLNLTVDTLRVGNREAPVVRMAGSYQDRRVTLDAHAIQGAREVFTVTGTVPLDLSFRSVAKRLLDDSLSLHIHADSAELAGLEGVAPQIQGLSGTLFADVAVRGTYKQVKGLGQARVRNGAFESVKLQTVGRGVQAHVSFANDSIRIDTLRMADGDSPRDTIAFRGVLFRNADAWQADITSVSKNFRIIDDPSFASVDATWNIHASGPIKHPQVEGQITLPEATFIVGQQRRIRDVQRYFPSEESDLVVGMPVITRLDVRLGSDVRLKSNDANVQLTGNLLLNGPLNDPTMEGEVNASHGTYRVNIGLLKRTFRVDSGTVRLDGALLDPRAPTLDVWASYGVRRQDLNDQITINAHVTGTIAAPRLQLVSSDLGTAVATSEIISYLLFGAPTVGLSGQASATVQTATAALVPSLGGVLESMLGSFVPFFSSLQVTSASGNGPQNIAASPLDGLLNSFALSAGRQVGSDSFINLSGGVCRGNRLSSAQSAPGWFGASIEYEPKFRLSAVLSMDPGVTPCTSVGKFSDVYQFGLDLFKDWRFK